MLRINRRIFFSIIFLILITNLYALFFISHNYRGNKNEFFNEVNPTEPTLINTSSSIEDSRITIQSSPSRYFVVNMPSFRPSGDLYIAQIAMDDDTPITTVPYGWTPIEDGYRGGYGEDVRLATYWKIGSSSEPSSYTWGVSYGYYEIWIGVIYRISNFDPDTPIHQSAVTTGESSYPSAPSVTTTIDDCLVFRMFASDDDWTVSAWPSGTTPLFQNHAGYNTVTSAAAAYNKTLAGNTGSGIFTIPSSDRWVGITIAITPPPDTTPPTYSDLYESSDPLQLGDIEVIRINTTDPSGINQVRIEFDGSNHSMTYVSGDMWKYNWTPNSVGDKFYTIWMEDNYNNWNSTSGSINVIDTTAPTYSDLIESADPLQLGDNETISIKAYDLSEIDQVLLEYNYENHTMISLKESTWSWSNWKPSSTGVYSYKIYIKDFQNNWNATNSYNITVISTTGPTMENLNESVDPLELGNNITISIDVVDAQNVSSVLIEIMNTNYTMINTLNNTYEMNWTGNSVGNVIYKVYANDTDDNWNTLTSDFDVVDTTSPNLANLTEFFPLLELGDTFNVTIDTWDLSGINQVRIEFEGKNQPMFLLDGNTYYHDLWTPSNAETHFYTIRVQDQNNNWNSITQNITVQDTIAPSYSDLNESDDPVELGTQLTISISVQDIADIKRVLIEYEGENHSMANLGEYLWQYDEWMPNRVGNYSYTIYMEDINNNYNFTVGSIEFQDTTIPTYFGLDESYDPLELGDTEVITVEIEDFAGINKTLIEFEGTNHSMENIYGNIWQYYNWTPTYWTIYLYTIYIEDNSGNNNVVIGNITVQDTTPPLAPIITNSPSGDVSGILTFDWQDGYDPSGISYYILLIDNETDPLITPGYVYMFNISNVGSESSYFELTEPLAQGKYYYFLYQIDGVGQQSEPTMGTFSIVSVGDPTLMNFIIIAVILASIIGVSSTIIIARKRIKKEILPAREKIPLKLIISHINKISDSDLTSVKKKGITKKNKIKTEKSLNKNLHVNEEMLKTRIDRIRAFGKELFAEGAYLEAQKQYDFAEKLLLRMGRKEEALEFSDLKVSIKELAEEREKKLEQLEIEKLGKDSLLIFELYNDLIELSLRLKDVFIADIYQSELIQVFQSDEQKLKDLEYQRFKLYRQANSFMDERTFEKSAELYEQCKRISKFLVKLGRENEVKNVEKFKYMINDCLNKASQLKNDGSES